MSFDNSRSRNYGESISALMDNEADDLELRRLLKEAGMDRAVGDAWRRFHLARAVLHNEDVRPLSMAASLKILDAVAAEPPYADLGKVGRRRNELMAAFAKAAIAASVALAVFLGLQSTLTGSVSDAPMVAEGSEFPVMPIQSDTKLQLLENDVEFNAEAQQRLNEYIRSVSIQYREEPTRSPDFNFLEDSQLIRQVNQIEN